MENRGIICINNIDDLCCVWEIVIVRVSIDKYVFWLIIWYGWKI